MQTPRDASVVMVCSAFMAIVGIITHNRSGRTLSENLTSLPLLGRWVMYYALVAGIVVLGVFDEGSFIYFKF